MFKAKLRGEQPSIFGNKFFIVLTGSMSPTIKVGDLIVVKDINPEQIQVNDVITFGSKASDNITTHRVKEVLNSGQEIQYVTQGDANNVEDPIPVESELLLGKVNKVIPKVGTILLWIQNNTIKLLIGVIALIIFVYLFSKLKDKLKRKSIEEEKEIIKQ